MNERDLETRLRHAYRAEAANADPGALIERVHSIPAIAGPARPRWWHRLRSDAPRSVGSGGIQVRGANNMFAASSITAIIAAVTLGGAFLASQVEPPAEGGRKPAAETGDSWITVTGQQSIMCNGDTQRCAGKNYEMSDPRLDGSVFISFELQHDPATEAFEGSYALAGDMVVHNGDGSWEGNWIGFADEQGLHRVTSWFTGTGAYEGLSYIEQSHQREDDGHMLATGLLFEGDIPATVVPPTHSIADPYRHD